MNIPTYCFWHNTDPVKQSSSFFKARNKIQSEINLKSKKPDVKIFFPRSDGALFAEVIIKRIGGENILAFSNQIINRLPVLKLGNSTIQSFALDLDEIPSGNYYFTISQLNDSCQYLERLTEVCHFSLVNNFESFSPIVKHSTKNSQIQIENSNFHPFIFSKK